jgi:hypothetical protein
MTDSRPGDGPLDALDVGEETTQAFGLLADETRLAILVALWEQQDPFDPERSTRFSDLRDRVGTADSGRFNYHLDRLDGHYVEATDDGYRLTAAGRRVVQSVVAGTGLEAPTLDPQPVGTTCTHCGGEVEITYDDGVVVIRCRDCAGIWPDEESDGSLAKFPLPPAGLADRSPAEVYAAAWVNGTQRLNSMLEGVCPICTGRVERSLDGCPDHAEEGRCPTCDRHAEIIGRLRCSVCKEVAQTTMGAVVRYHPSVLAFCHDHGLQLQFGLNDVSVISERLERMSSTVERRATDPLRVRVTTAIDGDTVWVDLDEDLRVVAVESEGESED